MVLPKHHVGNLRVTAKEVLNSPSAAAQALLNAKHAMQMVGFIEMTQIAVLQQNCPQQVTQNMHVNLYLPMQIRNVLRN